MYLQLPATSANRYRNTDVFRDKDGNVGEGDKVLADGVELTYASDASYCLMNDIPIDNENVWNFPSDFTGSITSSSERTEATQYMIL